MRIRKRDVKPGMTFYQCKDSNLQTLNKQGCIDEEEFVLIKPIRFSGDGKVETLTFLEEVSQKEYQIDSLYVEVEEELEIEFGEEKESYDEDKGGVGDTEPEDGKYLYMGKQVWLVYKSGDPGHSFRKEIRYLLGKSFDGDCKRKEQMLANKAIYSSVVDSISFEDYKSKDKRINKNYKNDDFGSIF